MKHLFAMETWVFFNTNYFPSIVGAVSLIFERNGSTATCCRATLRKKCM